MAAKQRVFFEDGVSYSDKSTFIDYPEVKIRSYDRPEGETFRTILIFVYLLIIISGLVYLFTL